MSRPSSNDSDGFALKLQMQHGFRWVVYSNHVAPVDRLLGRYLHRHLIHEESSSAASWSPEDVAELTAVAAWLPAVWRHINQFLEMHASNNLTIGKSIELMVY